MTQQHPITPPSELVQQWLKERTLLKSQPLAHTYLATLAAQWGADQELEACCEWIYKLMDRGLEWSMDLRTSRRPKPPSLREQALSELDSLENMGACNADIIRRALEQLND
jgi:hypothetical protein